MSVGYGFGKTILFGEHFVVYSLPAIASAISAKTVAKVEPAKRFEFADNRPQTPGYKEKKKEEIGRQLDALKNHFKIENVRITLSGDLTCASGVGASAALAASISRALNDYLKLGLSDEKINEAAFIAEKAGSGEASGIDNTCSVYGGFIIFQKNLSGGPNRIERIPVGKPMEIVMASSGITQTTKEVVEDVKRLKNENPKQYERIFSDYESIESEAVLAIKASDLKKLGDLMNKNQALLAEMTLSCREIDEIREAAIEGGAYGVKLTGTGRGGTVIALAPGKDVQEKVAKAIEKKGYKTLKTNVGAKG